MKLPIPVNIITGTLGVGKTTVVSTLLRQKPPEEKWALLVNEFGSLGIDATLITASIGMATDAADRPQPADAPPGSSRPASSPGGGVVVRELAGGCLCCTLSGPLGVAIAQLVRQTRPDRLIIEPSGLGHPAGLLDVLFSEHLRSALQLRAVICLVDVRVAAALEGAGAAGGGAAGAEELRAAAASETFQDQVNVADVVVGHKADLADEGQQRAFGRWAQQLYPPKMQVLLASHGQVDAALLDLPRTPVFRPMFSPQSHVSRRRAAQRSTRAPLTATHAQAMEDTGAGKPAETPGRDSTSEAKDVAATAPAYGAGAGAAPTLGIESLSLRGDSPGCEDAPAPPLALLPGRPVRFPSTSGAEGPGEAQGQVSCGWLFSAEDVFERGRLAEVLAALWSRAARLKGVFRVGKAAYVVPSMRPDGTVDLQPISYRRESRVELIVATPQPPAGAATTATTNARGDTTTSAVRQVETHGEAAGSNGARSGEAAGPGEVEEVGEEAGALAEAVASADWDAVERALLGALR